MPGAQIFAGILAAIGAALLALLLVPSPAAAQVSASCTVTPTGGQGEYTNGTPPQITTTLGFVCDWTNVGAEPAAAQQATICVTLQGGGAARSLARSGGGGTLSYEIGLQGPTAPALEEGSHVAVGELAIPALEAAESIEGSGQSALFAVTGLPNLPAVAAGTYEDTLSWSGYVADASASGTCDGAQGEIAGSSFSGREGSLSVELAPTCGIVSTTAVRFETVPGGGTLATSIYGQGGISVQCTGAVTYTIYLDHGQADPSGPRQMSNGAGGVLPYRLCKQAPCSGEWTETSIAQGVGGSGGVTVNGSTDPALTTVYGEIVAGTLVRRAGDYADQVQVTVAY
ncbi:spore coat U domain-containing protein [Novosphingobium sp. JCM 18896]|uniref:spore coat U domain-containing protein n=1 Tax=Novosphingobium sp. JCM 18896 TaxID=2989731 RepID=UPI002222EBFB|nr:spore coat U domain-containing protein [Novosphingobium sp. JCM 18896]MCW1430817.1 spore coat U domain-containing protein [Novosphingobium sp. JCM 18896]